MATSGDIYTGYFSEEYGSVRLRFHWSRTAYSVENNTSTIAWTITTDGTMTSGYWYKAGPIVMTMTATNGSFTGGSSSYSNSSRIQLRGGGTLVASGTAVLTHNATGVGSFSVSMSAAIYYTSANVSGSGTASLETIPRATTPAFSSQSVDIGTAVTISLPRASGSFTHTLRYSFGSLSDQLIGTDIGASVTWTPPASNPNLGEQIPNATSGVCTITCETYNGGTLIGTTTTTLTLTAPASWVPVNTTAFSSTKGALGYLDIVSALIAAVTYGGSNGSAVTSVTLTFQGKTYNAALPSGATGVTITSDPCSGSGSGQSAVTRVTDSRGRYTEVSTSIAVTAYTLPAVSLGLTRVAGADATDQDETGGYMRITLAASVAGISGNAVASKTLTYKIGSAESEISSFSLPYDSAAGSENVAVPNSSACTVTATITDTAGGTATVIRVLPVGFKTLDFLAGGKGINIGSTSVNEYLVSNMPIRLGAKVERKNLLKYPYHDSTKTASGITWTVNDDGSITVDGTATSNAYFYLTGTSNPLPLSGEKIVYSLVTDAAGGAVPSGVGYYIAFTHNGSSSSSSRIGPSNIPFERTYDTVNNIRLRINSGTTVSNLTLYPMVRDAGITDDTWEAYIPDTADIIGDYKARISSAAASCDAGISSLRSTITARQNKNLFRVEAQTKTIDLAEYAAAGQSSGVYLILLRPWTVSLVSGAVYLVSYITNDYGAATCIEPSANTSLTISGKTVTITFPDANGGMVAILGGPVI